MDRWVTVVVIFLLDTVVKAFAIIFWYFIFAPILRIWKH